MNDVEYKAGDEVLALAWGSDEWRQVTVVEVFDKDKGPPTYHVRFKDGFECLRMAHELKPLVHP